MEPLSLNLYNRNASLGADYKSLKLLYPLWSSELHAYGDIMENNKLETIAVEGLIKWYLTNNIQINIEYNYYESLVMFISNPSKISYYDMYELNKLAEFAKIPKIIETVCQSKDQEFLKKYKIDIFKKYSAVPWSKFMLDNITYDTIINFLSELKKFIEIKNHWFGVTSWYSTFLKLYPEIKKLGIIFQRFKVVLEKISMNSHKDIYKLDKFVDKIQETIYSICIYHINHMNKDITDKITIKGINDWINNDYFYSPCNSDKFDYEEIDKITL